MRNNGALSNGGKFRVPEPGYPHLPLQGINPTFYLIIRLELVYGNFKKAA